jgi:hypothetical protein
MDNDSGDKKLTGAGDKKLTGASRINRREPAEVGEPKAWWQSSRRRFIVGGTAAAAVAAAGGGIWWASRDDTSDVDQDSLDLQRAGGWNIGSEEKTLTLTGSQAADSQGRDGWRRYLDPSAMLGAFQPGAQEWMPFFVPTLIQSLQYESLRGQLTPAFTPGMKESYGRGQMLARDFLANAENAAQTAIIVDLPGRDSVALGAGLAEAARLIVTFDNFPHPLGVVPSHETLSAMLYYAGEIEAKQAAVPANAAPVFLLDSNRLATYTDADTQFDNRYLAKLPSAQKLQEMNVKSIIYVVPDRTRTDELDDLNENFVEYKDKSLNVAMLPMSDFVAADANAAGTWDDGTARADGERRYYYGGSPGFHPFFFFYYPFYSPRASYAGRYPGYAAGRPPAVSPVSPPRYIPAPRATMFSGTRVGGRSAAGVGRSKPSGFGRTTVRVGPSGNVVGTRAGRSGFYSPSRSGSFGRGGGYGG